MNSTNNWPQFVEDFKQLSEEDRYKVWNYVKKINERNNLLKKKDKSKENKGYRHLNFLSDEAKLLCIEVHQKYAFDLYQSIRSTVSIHSSLSNLEIHTKYCDNNLENKPYLLGKEKELMELIRYHVIKNKDTPKDEKYRYLEILSKETQEFVIRINEEEGLNLYHSVSAILSNSKNKKIDDIVDEYYKKYLSKRPYLENNRHHLRELFEKINNKLNK